jgi:dTDP-glucose 4,6-dehydratase
LGVISEVRLWVGALQNGDFSERLAAHGFDAIVHMAGNTHVDRSISNPLEFTHDNVLGTNTLLDALRRHGHEGRVLIYSTDEVFGPTPDGERFTEDAALRPSNAYSASKVGVEGLARAFYVTHGMQTIVVRPCNTYGPRQHPEKVIPRFVRQVLRGEPLTIHRDGMGARDWLHASDHARAVEAILHEGMPGSSYNMAAGDEHTDLEIAEGVCRVLNKPMLVRSVEVRPGHDKRYWMDNTRLRGLGWQPLIPFASGFRDTVLWNAEHQDWWDADWVKPADLVGLCA